MLATAGKQLQTGRRSFQIHRNVRNPHTGLQELPLGSQWPSKLMFHLQCRHPKWALAHPCCSLLESSSLRMAWQSSRGPPKSRGPCLCMGSLKRLLVPSSSSAQFCTPPPLVAIWEANQHMEDVSPPLHSHLLGPATFQAVILKRGCQAAMATGVLGFVI